MAWNSLLQKYNRRDVLYDLNSFLRNFTKQERAVDISKKKYEHIDSAYYLGKNDLFSVFEIHHHHISDARVGLTKQAVEIMKSRLDFTQRAIFFFVPKNSNTFRISLVTFDWANNKPSNPRRYSFLVGENQKVRTAIQQLSKPVTSEEDLLKRFSIEVVNDEFYDKISEHFEDLLKAIEYPNICPQEKLEETKRNFAVRLIGRLIFCWFLKKKIRQDGSALIPEDLLSSSVVSEYANYYHEVLEPLFFETLNKQPQDRIEKCHTELFSRIPFLNGGLFEAHDPEDGYKYDEKTGMCYLGTAVKIPNDWFIKFFETLETYNFTIDENTSTDIDLAVDPEMLGRIFENLLASINPETEESVRKATGSYYTPREIVDYMVTQSLKQYLYTKTDIDHAIIDSLFEFDPKIDEKTLPSTRKQQICAALSEIKVLDPAVGSGAFPMGVLQKMLYIINLIVPQKDKYSTKLSLIQKCIYGVDIQPMAIEICRLRFFLTLIVEEESDEPKPLPNLNFNFACANTLIPLDNNNLVELKQKMQNVLGKIKEKKESLPIKGQNLLNLSKEEQKQIKSINKDLIKLNREKESIKRQLEVVESDINTFLNGENYIAQLREHRKEFFTASGKRKEELKEKFSATQDEMLDALQANEWGNDKVLKLQAWRPFDNFSTGWFDPFWMFGVEDGFDIVIGNPPYVVYGLNRELLDVYKQKSNAYQRYKDNKRQTNLFAFMLEKGIDLLKDRGVLAFIIPHSFVRVKGYEYLRKYLFQTNKIPYHIVDEGSAFQNVTLEMVSVFITNMKYMPSISFLSRRDGKTRNMPMNYYRRYCRPYLYWDKITEKMLGFQNGYITGFRGFSGKGRDNGDLKLLGGKNTKTYFIDSFDSFISSTITDQYFTDEKALDNQEICITQFGVLYPRGTIVNTEIFCPSGGNVIVKHNSKFDKKCVLAILNSKLIACYFAKDVLNGAELTIHLDGQYLEQIPLPKISTTSSQCICAIVDKILCLTQSENYVSDSDKQSRVKAYQNEIDQLVYKLYGLTEEEIKIVEESQTKKK